MESNALFMVEPYLGLNLFSDATVTQPANKLPKKYHYQSLVFGSRLGVSMFSMQLGVDYSLAKANVEIKTEQADTVPTEENISHSKKDLGVFLGYDLDPMRFWYTKFLSSSLTQNSGADNGLAHKGGGSAFGFGYKFLEFLSGNVEYRSISYDEEEDTTQADPVATAKSESLDFKELLFSVSAVFDFF